MSTRSPAQLYEADFYAWTQAQAKELRRFARLRSNAALDLVHIAEEIRDLGKRERDAAFSLAQRIIEHLLLIEHAPATDHRLHWADEIDEFRDRLERKLSPTIRRHLNAGLDELFARARALVARKMRRHGERRAAAALPAACPYSLHQILATGCRTSARRTPPEPRQDAPGLRSGYRTADAPRTSMFG